MKQTTSFERDDAVNFWHFSDEERVIREQERQPCVFRV